MPTRRSYPPLLCARGVRPSQAANCRPDWKSVASGTAAAIALARDRTDARDRRQSATGIAGAVPRHYALLDPCDLVSDNAQLIDEAVQRYSGQLWQTILRLMQRDDCRGHAARPAGGDDAQTPRGVHATH